MKKPTVFGKYLLLERISVGGMAEVFKAKYFGEEGFEKILAIKRILPSMVEDEQFITMFIDEAKIAGELSHPAIGQILELGKIETAHFIAMEFVWGKDVLQIQNRFKRYRQKMPPVMATYIASRVCEGLDYAHHKTDASGKAMGIIHRDVSPQNILVSYSGEVKIIDFGIAKARSRSSKTQAGVLKGKFGYMSPEQVRGLPLDRRSDIFSIGTLLWEMCVGERLFTGETDFATLDKVRNADVRPPSAVNPNVPPEIDTIVLKALQRDPDKRYEHAADMQEDLTTILMSERPMFKSKGLGQTITKMFAAERQREQLRLEEYQVIRKEDMPQFADPQLDNREMVMSMVSLDNVSAEELQSDDLLEMEEEDNGEATTVGGPAFFFEDVEGDMVAAHDPSMGAAAYDVGGAVQQMAPAEPEPEEFTAEPTFIFNVESGQIQAAAQPGGLPEFYAPMPTEAEPDQGPTVLFNVGAAAKAAQEPLPPIQEPTTDMTELPSEQISQISATMPVPIIPARRSSIVKDVLIGVLLAMVVILGIVVWRVVASGSSNATLVITTNPAAAAEVFVDGLFKGKMIPGTPFTLKGVSAKEHRVTLRAPGIKQVERQVDLGAGDVKVVSVALKKAEENGYLTLSVAQPGYSLRVDDKPLPHTSGKAMPLKAGVQHTVRIEKPGFVSQTLSFKLKGGEKASRAVTLKAEAAVAAKPTPDAAAPAVAGLKLVSVPSGAEVSLDGKPRGKTPLELADVPPGKHALKLTLKGHLEQAKEVDLAAGKQLALKLTLAKAPPPEKKPPVVAAKAPEPKKPAAKPVKVAAKPKPASKPKPAPKPKPVSKPKPAKPKPVKVASKPKSTAKPKKPKAKKGKNVGYLMAMTMPWGAKVIVDGRNTGLVTPIPKNKLPLRPGKHRVTFVHSGKKFKFPVTITKGEHTKLVKKLKI